HCARTSNSWKSHRHRRQAEKPVQERSRSGNPRIDPGQASTGHLFYRAKRSVTRASRLLTMPPQSAPAMSWPAAATGRTCSIEQVEPLGKPSFPDKIISTQVNSESLREGWSSALMGGHPGGAAHSQPGNPQPTDDALCSSPASLPTPDDTDRTCRPDEKCEGG